MKHSIVLASLAFVLDGCAAPADDPAPPARQLVQQPDTAEARRERRRQEVLRRMQTMPRFEQFPARDTFTGTPAPVDLSSAEGARRFRTVLSGAAANGPNFAGHYAVTEWGCGTGCQSYAIVDLRTGRVTFGDGPLEVGAGYRLDSELLVANPPEEWLEIDGAGGTDAVSSGARSVYYRWDGRRLIALDSLPIGRDARW